MDIFHYTYIICFPINPNYSHWNLRPCAVSKFFYPALISIKCNFFCNFFNGRRCFDSFFALHLAFQFFRSEKVLQKIIEIYPMALEEIDDDGRIFNI